MKTIITLITFLLAGILNTAFGQNPSVIPTGGEAIIERNTQPCVSSEARDEIFRQIDQNISRLQAEERYIAPNRQGNHPLFIWPVKQADGFNYNSVWALTNYLDHNPAVPNLIEDYDCGTRSYDTTSGYNHQGFDIITWPFWWKQMDLDQGINVAAADGQIVAKQDGNFDRHCSFNNDPLNGIAIQHSDGSTTLYYHFKNGGLTSKEIGDTVVAGEYLGVIGSSGSSTLPHLHFEVYDNNDDLIDPSIGPCNNLNNDTWWEEQKPYYTPGINAALTHTAPPEFNTCPETETTNESDQFDLGDIVYYAIYLRDQRQNTLVDLKITRPDNSVQFDWDYELTDDFNISYWLWNFEVDMEGEWTWEATYNGETATHTFNVGALGVESEELSNSELFPNPTNGNVSIDLKSFSEQTTIVVSNILGQTLTQKQFYDTKSFEFQIEGNAGLYFVTLLTLEGTKETFKVIKK